MKKTIRFGTDADIPDIRLDGVFKAVFTRDTPQSRGALKGLLSCFTGLDISVLSITANEPAGLPGDRQIRYDISCRFDDGNLADIEMTIGPRASESLRLEFYTSRLFVTQQIRGAGRSYRDLKLTFQISFISGRKLFQDEELVHRFEYCDMEHGLRLGGRTRIITVELDKTEAVLGKGVEQMSSRERWAVFLRCSADRGKREMVNAILEREEAIAMAGETMLEFTKEELEWFRNESRLKYELDMRETIADARDEAREEGWEKGRGEGIAIGAAQEAERNRKEKLRAARNLKRMGLSAGQAASALGLSAADLKDLSAEKDDGS
jgi:predicted transposase/invertase (TIGR01784 family)